MDITVEMPPSKKTNTPPTSDSDNTKGPLTFEKVWLMFQKTGKKLNKLERLFTS
ncbi:MAG: hypothetical protein BWY45_01074 [Euryarchaeota archaeon ADurb.Bin294]|jgi:hypothetical protein|nr:MAG: hypothetical protein BWY45_01074 [Euryarchaeota archaeon ADurb.Bin294]